MTLDELVDAQGLGPPTVVPAAGLRVRSRRDAVRVDVDLGSIGLGPDGATLWVAGCEAGILPLP